MKLPEMTVRTAYEVTIHMGNPDNCQDLEAWLAHTELDPEMYVMECCADQLVVNVSDPDIKSQRQALRYVRTFVERYLKGLEESL
jgi:hypothetical protein